MSEKTDVSTTPLPGFNPHNVRGVELPLADDARAYVVPDRGLDVLEVRVQGESAMWANPAGHLRRPIGDLAHVEGFFTAGLENTGPPVMGLPLHGTYAWRPAAEVRQTTAPGGQAAVEGVVAAVDMVRGPYLQVHRQVRAVGARRAFLIEDTVTATVESEFMLLYHPNFPATEGAKLEMQAEVVAARDAISDYEIEGYATLRRVGEGRAVLPPAETAPAIVEENFERCYAIKPVRDADGGVTAMLTAADNASAVYVRYGAAGFDAAQRIFYYWKNPRGGVAGLEFGNCPLGRDYARQHNLLSRLAGGEQRRYQVEVGFLRSADEVDQFRTQHRLDRATPELRSSPAASGVPLADLYRS